MDALIRRLLLGVPPYWYLDLVMWSSAPVSIMSSADSVTVTVPRGSRWRLCHSIAQFVDSNPNLLDLVPNVLYPLDVVLETINLRYSPAHASHLGVCSFFAPMGPSLARLNRSVYSILDLKHISRLPTRNSGVSTNLVNSSFCRSHNILQVHL